MSIATTTEQNHKKTLGEKGKASYLSKDVLQFDTSYQRPEITAFVWHIARNFSWKLFGTVSVSQRINGEYFVFDGQHRVLAARLRDDIDNIPCLVFNLDGVSEEAEAFLDLNTERADLGEYIDDELA